MSISIAKLADYPEYFKIVVDWLYSEWGDENYQFWKSWVKSSLNKEGIPMTFVLLIDGQLAGTYSIWTCDLQSRQDLSPWFGGLYVSPTYRGKMIDGTKLGELMQKHAIKIAAEYGIKKMYLFTEKKPDYYIRNGWSYVGPAYDEHDKIVSICEIRICDL